MLRWFMPLLALAVGCQSAHVDVPSAVEGAVIGLAPAGSAVEIIPCQAAAADPPVLDHLDLQTLWSLALGYNPSLREAAADVEAARGRLVQAGLYPNPHVV